MDKRKNKWSQWKDLEKEPCSYEKSAIYKIRLSNHKGKPIAIPRFLKKDKNGILMIGRTKNLKRRLNNFRRAVEKNISPHSEGKKFHLIKSTRNFKTQYGSNWRLEYSFKRLCKNQIKKEEEKTLKNYFKEYGELPVLNSILPKRKIQKK
ncbi:MAG: hypothetical protein ABIK40_03710 [candidate division WOR-3 bacterium]